MATWKVIVKKQAGSEIDTSIIRYLYIDASVHDIAEKLKKKNFRIDENLQEVLIGIRELTVHHQNANAMTFFLLNHDCRDFEIKRLT